MSNIVKQAEDIVEGKSREYEDSFSDIAKLWSVYLNMNLTDLDVAQMMILFKFGRMMNVQKKDNIVDLVGYALCAEKIMFTEEDF